MILFRYTIEAGVNDDLENCLTEINGSIIHCTEAGDGKIVEKTVGAIKSFDGGNALDTKVSLYDVYDLRQQTEECYNALYTSGGEIRKSVSKLFSDEILTDNVLLIDRMEIDPQYRGKRIGLAAMYYTMQKFGHGCSLIVIKPFPLQFEARTKGKAQSNGDLKVAMFTRNESDAVYRLRTYYGLMGFLPIPGTRYMALNMHLKTPKPEQFGFDSLAV